MSLASDPEIINVRSNHSVDQTVEKLKDILTAQGVSLFALVDHSGEAEKVGLKILPTKLLIFGSPKAGTPLMLAAPTCAIDLPLKVFIREDDEGSVWVSLQQPGLSEGPTWSPARAAAEYCARRNARVQNRTVSAAPKMNLAHRENKRPAHTQKRGLK
jgi:uncharacterized protein (DUF302 family)